MELVVAVLLVFLGVLIALENAVVCLLVFRYKSLRSHTNGFIASLAVADFLYGSLIIPLHVRHGSSNVSSYMLAMVLLANVTTLMGVTLDRYMVVLYPILYQPFMEKHFFKLLIASWILPILISLVPIIYSSDFKHRSHEIYVYCVVVLGVVLPYMIILLAYFRIFRRVSQQVKYLARHNEGNTEAKREGKRMATEAYVAKIFVIIAIIFVVSWLPVVYMTIVSNIGRHDLIPYELTIASWFTLSLGSLINAPIYAFAKKDFNTVIKKIICLKKRQQSLHQTEDLDTGDLMITGQSDT